MAPARPAQRGERAGLVGEQQLHALRAQEPRAADLAAVHQRLEEAGVVVGVARHPRAAAVVADGLEDPLEVERGHAARRREGHVLAPGQRHRALTQRQRALGRARHRHEAFARYANRAEGPALDPERPLDALGDEGGERPAGDALDDRAEHVGAERVVELLAGLEGERHLREAAHRLLRRHVRVGQPVHDARGAVRLDHVGAVHEVVGEAGGVRHQLAHRRRRARRGERPVRLAHAQPLEDGQVARDGVVEADPPLLDELHRRHRGDELGHGGEAEQVRARGGGGARRVARAGRAGPGRTAILPDHSDDAGRRVALDELAHRPLHRGGADGGRARDGRQRQRRGKGERSRGAQEQAAVHGVFLPRGWLLEAKGRGPCPHRSRGFTPRRGAIHYAT